MGRLERQGNALTIEINFENFNSHFIANLNNFVRVIDVLPGEFGYVNESVYATEVNECTEVDYGADDALTDLPLLEFGEEVLTNCRLRVFEPRTT